MKAKTSTQLAVATLIATGMATTVLAQSPKMKMTTEIPPQVTTPDKVDTSMWTPRSGR
jgi:hypothetical protein